MSIETLCQILCHDGSITARRYRAKPGYKSLLKAGLIEESGVVEGWYCDDCSQGHAASIVHEQGRYGYFCLELGFVPLERDAIVAVKACVAKLISRLADLLKASTRKSEPVRGHTWRIGRLRSEHGDLSIYYHPALASADDLSELKLAIADEVGTRFRLILNATGTLPVGGSRVVSLSEVVEIGSDGEIEMATDIWALAGLVVTSPTGRPNTYGAPVKDLARQRIASGEALRGLKTEANVIKGLLWNEETKKGPSLTSVRRYLAEVREGPKKGQN